MKADRAFAASQFGIAKHNLKECRAAIGSTFENDGYLRNFFYYSRVAKRYPNRYKANVSKQLFDLLSSTDRLADFVADIVSEYEI